MEGVGGGAGPGSGLGGVRVEGEGAGEWGGGGRGGLMGRRDREGTDDICRYLSLGVGKYIFTVIL